MFNTRFAMEVATALFTAVLGLIICAGSARHGISWNDQGPQAGFFPFYIGCMVLIGSAVNLAQAMLARRRLNGHFIESGRVRDVAAFFAAIIMFAVLVGLLGLYVGIALYLPAVTLWKAKLRPARAALLGLGVALFFYACFEYAFKLPLPKGPLLNLLGIY